MVRDKMQEYEIRLLYIKSNSWLIIKVCSRCPNRGRQKQTGILNNHIQGQKHRKREKEKKKNMNSVCHAGEHTTHREKIFITIALASKKKKSYFILQSSVFFFLFFPLVYRKVLVFKSSGLKLIEKVCRGLFY